MLLTEKAVNIFKILLLISIPVSMSCSDSGTQSTGSTGGDSFIPAYDVLIADTESYLEYVGSHDLFSSLSCDPTTNNTCSPMFTGVEFSRTALYDDILYVGAGNYSETIRYEDSNGVLVDKSIQVSSVFTYRVNPNNSNTTLSAIGSIQHSDICDIADDENLCLSYFDYESKTNLHGKLSYPAVFGNRVAIGSSIAYNPALYPSGHTDLKTGDGAVYIFEKDPNGAVWTVTQRLSPEVSCEGLADAKKQACIESFRSSKFSRASIIENMVAVGAYEAFNPEVLDSSNNPVETGLIVVFELDVNGLYKYHSTLNPIEICEQFTDETEKTDCITNLKDIRFGNPALSADGRMMNVGVAGAMSPILEVETGLNYEFRYNTSSRKWEYFQTIDPAASCSPRGLNDADCKKELEESKFSYTVMNETRMLVGARDAKINVNGTYISSGLVYVYQRIEEGGWKFVKILSPASRCEKLPTVSEQNDCMNDLAGIKFQVPSISKDDNVFIGAPNDIHKYQSGSGTTNKVTTGVIYHYNTNTN